MTTTDAPAPQPWGARPRGLPGVDATITKVAVEFQNLTGRNAEGCLRENLELLREAAGCETAFVLRFDARGSAVDAVIAACAARSACEPAALRGESLQRWSWLLPRLDHLRMSELRDTASPRLEQAVEAQRFARAGLRSVLLVAFGFQGERLGWLGLGDPVPRPGWDANLQLLLKLLGNSLACGFGRIRLENRLAALQDREALVSDVANDGFWDFDVARDEMHYSPRWRAMLGYDGADADPNPDWRSLVHPDDVERVQRAIRDHIAGRTPAFESTHRMRHRCGEWRWVQSRAQATLDAQGRLRRLVGSELDVTERKLFERALFREKESAQIALQSIGDGVITIDDRSLVDYINPVAEQLTGWRLEDAIGRPVEEIFRTFHEETCEPLDNPLVQAVRRVRSLKSPRPTLLIRRDGNELYVESTAAPIRDGAGSVCGGVLVFHDVTEKRELNRRLSHQASHDILTGLVNRREFESRVERAMHAARAREATHAVCHLDLDQFRMINDSCGHAAGDALLSQVGALLKARVRWRDTLARLGGDEFGILLEGCAFDEAMRMAEGLREAVRNFRFTWEDRVFRLGASVGVVPVTAGNDDVASLLSAADSACQAAKEAGRDRVYSFGDNDVELMRRRREMQWAARINAALEESRFELFRMPIQPLQGEEAGTHYELLLRMRDEGGRLVTPDNFIAAAERYSLTPAIDRWVIESAFRWLVSDSDEREKLALCAINLSGQSLGDDKFLPFVIEQFQHSGIDAARICFEITETAAVANFSQASRFIQALRELGCRFSLDDFGTGLSSFGYLKHFPVDYLKIDGSFIRGIASDPIDREMVRSINEVGHLTGKRTIAEFAESADIIETLRGMGIDYAQGYGIGEPVPLFQPAGA